jgi:tRNA(fMet)-specific endonuclease VapC
MNYLLDSDICIHLINSTSEKAWSQLSQCDPLAVRLSAISIAELRFGAAHSQSKQHNHDVLDEFIERFEIINFDEKCAMAYGEIRAALTKSGTLIGPMDMLIAAQAIAYDLTLVTANKREFERVRKLRVIDWL